jgi:hypothetical protein
MIRLRALAVAPLLLALVVASGSAANATAKRYPLNPAANIPVPSYVFTGACYTAPTGQDCTSVLVTALNHARAVMGEPAYALPVLFTALTPAERLLMLADQDRMFYGRTRLSGLNATLNASAKQGVVHDRDPAFVDLGAHTHYVGGASNWAAGSAPMTNPLYAYYLWMYNDGPGSGNIDCTKPGDPGCWGHRDGTLYNFGSSVRVLLGVGGGTSRFGYSWTELFEAFRTVAVTPLIATIQRLDHHSGAPGSIVHVTGFGLLHVGRVYVVGHSATIVHRDAYHLDIRVPAGSGSGYVIADGDGGPSNSTAAAAFSYAG